jgi:capsular polysaccharide transport system permease protein
MTEGILAQLNVIKALTIRELQGSNSNYNYGYAWAFLEICLTLAVLLVLKTFIRGLSPPDMPPILFLLLGAIPWYTFHGAANSMLQVVSQRKNLLSLPGVTTVDIMLAKATSVLCIYGSIFFLALVGSDYFEAAGLPRFATGLVLTYFASWVLGIGFGMTLMPIVRVFPPGTKFLSLIWRFGLLLSGVYFTITAMPETYWGYLTWNPMLHVSELMRTYWFSTYQTPIGSPLYLSACVLGMLAFGLSLERYVRYRAPA